jgi:hypothetical protein
VYFKVLILITVLVLHPRHKLHYFKVAGWEAEWIEAAKTLVREEFERSYASSEAPGMGPVPSKVWLSVVTCRLVIDP